jgi:hypothetical protein
MGRSGCPQRQADPDHLWRCGERLLMLTARDSSRCVVAGRSGPAAISTDASVARDVPLAPFEFRRRVGSGPIEDPSS